MRKILASKRDCRGFVEALFTISLCGNGRSVNHEPIQQISLKRVQKDELYRLHVCVELYRLQVCVMESHQRWQASSEWCWVVSISVDDARTADGVLLAHSSCTEWWCHPSKE